MSERDDRPSGGILNPRNWTIFGVVVVGAVVVVLNSPERAANWVADTAGDLWDRTTRFVETLVDRTPDLPLPDPPVDNAAFVPGERAEAATWATDYTTRIPTVDGPELGRELGIDLAR